MIEEKKKGKLLYKKNNHKLPSLATPFPLSGGDCPEDCSHRNVPAEAERPGIAQGSRSEP